LAAAGAAVAGAFIAGACGERPDFVAAGSVAAGLGLAWMRMAEFLWVGRDAGLAGIHRTFIVDRTPPF